MNCRVGTRVAVAILSSFLVWGCATGLRDPDAVRDHVTALTGVEYSRERGLEIGKGAMMLGKIAVEAAGAETPDALAGLREVRYAQFRPYPSVTDRQRAVRIQADDFRAYDAVVTFQSKQGEDVLLLSRGSRDSIKELLLVLDGPERLAVVQLRGDLEEILEHAVRLAFSKVDRDDLSFDALNALSELGFSPDGGETEPEAEPPR
jgi:hypothetical protein